MNLKHLIPALMLGVAVAAYADGYKDGIEYYKAGQFDNAREILERNINDAATDKAMAYYYLGQADLAQGNQTSAKANFDKGIAANAENPYNYVGLGAIQLLNGDQKGAEANFSTAQKLGKKNNEITVDIARAYYNADPVKYSSQIEKHLTKAHKDSKDKEPAIYIFEGDRLFDQKELGSAAAKYEQAITFDEGNPEGYVKYANAYMGVNPLYGVEKLEQLVALQPNSALAQRELAEKYYETSQWTKAADQYGKYIQNPNHFPQDKARYAVLLYANEEYQKSLDIANELLNSLPKNDPNYFVMNRMRLLDLAALNRNEEAAQAAQAFFALPTSDKVKFNPIDYTTYGTVLENLGQDSLALIQFEGAVAADPTKLDNLKNLSNAYNKAGKYHESAATFQKWVEAQDNASLNDYWAASTRWLNSANQANLAGNEEMRTADAQAGIDDVNKVIENTNDVKPIFYQRLGRLAFAKAGKSDENVRDAYMKAVEILDANPANADPSNANNQLGLYSECYLFLGNFYQEQGDKENRDAMYEKSDYYKELLNPTSAE